MSDRPSTSYEASRSKDNSVYFGAAFGRDSPVPVSGGEVRFDDDRWLQRLCSRHSATVFKLACSRDTFGLNFGGGSVSLAANSKDQSRAQTEENKPVLDTDSVIVMDNGPLRENGAAGPNVSQDVFLVFD